MYNVQSITPLPNAIPPYMALSASHALASGNSSSAQTAVMMPPTNDNIYSMNTSDSTGLAKAREMAAPKGSVRPDNVAMPTAFQRAYNGV